MRFFFFFVSFHFALSLTREIAMVFSKAAMKGASDQLREIMGDIVDKAQQLVKTKIATLPMAANQGTGIPTITTNPPVPMPQTSTMTTEDKSARKKSSIMRQQYPDWDTRQYTDNKSGRQARWDAYEKQRQKQENEAAKRDLLVYKQLIFELKTVQNTEKDKKVRKVVRQEIQANEDIVKTMKRSGVPDVPLPKDIVLQVTTESVKKQGAQGSESPRTRRQAAEEVEGEDYPKEEVEKAINRKKHGG